MEICFATNNENKLEEVRHILSKDLKILSLLDIGCHEELPEEQTTLEGNSHQKAAFVFDKYQVPCFADDTGLEVFALDGAPGVQSARYAGPQRSNTDNIKLLLKNLEEKPERHAQFRTVITLIMPGSVKQFEGIIKGAISTGVIGTNGFGYDSVFIPDKEKRTFAEMTSEEKNVISHRKLAVEKLAFYLNNNIKSE